MFFVLRKFYSGEKNWFTSYPAVIIYLFYLTYIFLADRNDHTIFILRCPQCGIPFFTKNSNFGRKDILCTFGCRQNHKKAKSRERSKKYCQNPANKDKKKKLNRSRSLIDKCPKEVSSKKVDPFVFYLKLVLQSILLTNFQTREIVELHDFVRSRGLSFYQRLVHYSDYG